MVDRTWVLYPIPIQDGPPPAVIVTLHVPLDLTRSEASRIIATIGALVEANERSSS